jgi:hypothetical protein
MAIPGGRAAGCAALWVLASAVVLAGGQAAPPKPAAPPPTLDAPWPDDATIAARRVAAENRPLFASSETLAVTITADFKAVIKDRKPDSPRRYPGTLTVAAAGGQGAPIPMGLGTRGKSRLDSRTCDFPPLRIDFDKTALAGTVFDGQSSLKIVTHCRDTPEYAPYLAREYLAYRVFNLHTSWSMRARFAQITYVDSSSGKSVAKRHALFLEDDDDVARRNGGRDLNIRRVPYSALDFDATARLALLQYLVANSDYGFIAPHNIAVVQNRAGRVVPVAYDFDVSGLVNAHYAAVNRKLGILTPRERVYRGPCRDATELEPLLEEMRQKQADVLALYDTVPELDRDSRRYAREFLGEFYKTISSPDRVKKAFLDRCGKYLAR